MSENKAIDRSKLRNPFGVVDGTLMHISDIHKNMSIKCPSCGNILLVRDGDKTVKHLYHKANFNCNSENESFIHKCIKEFLFQRLSYIYLANHKIIVKSGKLMLSDSERLEVKEKYLEYFGVSSQYRPDIFLRLEGNYNVSIEICYKNKKNIPKLKSILKNLDIDMVMEIEVDENDLMIMNLNALLKKGKIIYNPIAEDFIKVRDSLVTKIKKTNEIFRHQIERVNYKNLYNKQQVKNIKLEYKIDVLRRRLGVSEKEVKDLKCKLNEKYSQETYRIKYEEELDRSKVLFDAINNIGEMHSDVLSCSDTETAINTLSQLNDIYLSGKKKNFNYLEIIRDLVDENSPDDFEVQKCLRDIGKVQDSLNPDELDRELKRILKLYEILS